MISTENGNGMVMPVAPMYGGGYGNNGGFGFDNGNGAWWILLFFIFAAMGGNGWGNNFGGGGAMPYILNNSTNNDVQRGFDQAALTNGIGNLNTAVTTGFAGVNQNLCSGFAGVNQGVANGFAQAEIANNARQIADMNQNFQAQIANMQQMNALQSQFAQCCCDNRLATANLNATILSENCADRNALSEAILNLTMANNASTQRLIDTINTSTQGVYNKICQIEMDGKNDRIADLQRQLTASDTKAEIAALKGAILNDNALQTNAIENYVRPQANPAYIVQNPNGCNCNNYYPNQCCAG